MANDISVSFSAQDPIEVSFTAASSIVAASQSEVNAGTAAGVYVDPVTAKNADYSTSISFGSAITCDNKGGDYMTAPAGNLSFTKAVSGHINFGYVLCFVASEAGRTLTFSTDFLENNSADSNYDDTHDCNIVFYKSPLSSKLNYSIIDLGEAADVTAPTLSAFAIATATPNRVTFNSSEAITASTFAGFTITGKTISSINIAAGLTTGHYFVVSSNFVQGSAYTIAYDGTDDWEDASTNAVASFTATAITNNVDNPDITAASVESAAPSNFVFTAERAITGTTTGWTPKINGTPATKTGFSGSGTTTITITVSETVVNGDVLTFDYSGGDMVDQYTNVMQAISGQAVANNVSAAFVPSDVGFDFYDAAMNTLNGISDSVAMGNINAGIFSQYTDIYIKIQADDGQPATSQALMGTFQGTNNATRFVVFLGTTGNITVRKGAVSRNSTNQQIANGAMGATTLFKLTYGYNSTSIVGTRDGSAMTWDSADYAGATTQTAANQFEGCLDVDGAKSSFYSGRIAIAVRTAATPLAGQDITDMETWISNNWV